MNSYTVALTVTVIMTETRNFQIAMPTFSHRKMFGTSMGKPQIAFEWNLYSQKHTWCAYIKNSSENYQQNRDSDSSVGRALDSRQERSSPRLALQNSEWERIWFGKKRIVTICKYSCKVLVWCNSLDCKISGKIWPFLWIPFKKDVFNSISPLDWWKSHFSSKNVNLNIKHLYQALHHYWLQ